MRLGERVDSSLRLTLPLKYVYSKTVTATVGCIRLQCHHCLPEAGPVLSLLKELIEEGSPRVKETTLTSWGLLGK